MTSLSGILGQQRAVATLRAALTGGRVHHAWVFTGPMGVGKRTAAEAFAAALLDPTTAPDLAGVPEPDPASQVQRLIAAGTHPDLHIITKELARYSEDRQIRERKLLSIPKEVIEQHLLQPIALAASLKMGGAASKVFIIDEAERLDRSRTNAPVQNSMLKCMEEPPAGSVIILVTSAEEMLLPTIRSRCQRVVFGPLDDASMDRWLASSGIEAEGAERRWLLEYAAGSPGRLVQAHEGNMYEWSRALDPMLADLERGKFPAALGSTMASLIDEWAKEAVSKNPQASKEAANVTGTRAMLTMLAERARRRLREAASRGEDCSPHARAIDAVERADRDVAAHVGLVHVMDSLAAQWACARD